MCAVSPDTRLQVIVSGIVQGVGFRPFVYTLAFRHGLNGFVRNNGAQAEIEIQGPQSSISAFLDDLPLQLPHMAVIAKIDMKEISTISDTTFKIIESTGQSKELSFVPPDTAVCSHCLAELFDSSDRRFRYPFINCTNCGPRFTIIKSLPYDRGTTTMAPFRMCQLCRQEYEHPGNRRFHAQPNACPDCGPSLCWMSDSVTAYADEALAGALNALAAGSIIAVKGIGGFHLICDATNKSAIQKLRRRKHRAKKPLAIMFSNLEAVNSYCRFTEEEKTELSHWSRPVVLLEKKSDCRLPDELAPGSNRLGVMLPCAPLHYLMLADFGKPLVATSGNCSEDPIVIDNDDARVKLAALADGFLLHDRQIHSRYDDSIVQFVGPHRTVMRRARGLAPLPVQLPFTANRSVLAVGGHLKNTFCLIRGDQAFVSQHIGDLGNIESEGHFRATLDIYKKLFDVEPELIAHDLHPDYISTEIARSFAKAKNLPVFSVQHHHAHIAACMIEHGLTGSVIGIAWDGTGYGDDGTLWGGEFLLCTAKDFKRIAHFNQTPMPGGSQAIKQPWRMTLGYIFSDALVASDLYSNFFEELIIQHGRKAVEMVSKQIAAGFNSPLTSSAGRLFDAVSALLGICEKVDYEGQAAIELEVLAHKAWSGRFIEQSANRHYACEIVANKPPFIINVGALLTAVYRDRQNTVPLPLIALRFHQALSCIILDVCRRIRSLSASDTVCLSGGVFQNRLLLSLSNELLINDGFKTYFPKQLPANDGGLSFGQAVVALFSAGAVELKKSAGVK